MFRAYLGEAHVRLFTDPSLPGMPLLGTGVKSYVLWCKRLLGVTMGLTIGPESCPNGECPKIPEPRQSETLLLGD